MIELLLKGNRVLIKAENIETLDVIRKRFTVPNPNIKYCPHASLTISPITPLGSFKIGMFQEIYEVIEELFPFEEIIVDKNIATKAFPRIKKDALNEELLTVRNTEFVYRDYQQRAIDACLNIGRGVILLPTRSGKSLVMYGLNINMKTNITLIVVPNIQLVKQMHQDFLKYGCDEYDVQVFSGYSHDIKNKPGIIITNAQYLLKHQDEIPEFDTLFLDEVHGLKKGSKLSAWLQLQNIDIVFGYTGTLPEGQEDIWNIKEFVGSIIYEEKVADMQQMKILADVKIYPIRIKHSKKEKYVVNNYEDIVKKYLWECGVIEACDESNQAILDVVSQLPGNTLILFDHIDHGRKLFKMLKHDNKCFVDGTVKLADRELTREKMGEKGHCITIANCKCFGTGITLKEIQNIAFAMSGKGVTKIIQAIGRSLERNKEHANLIDFFHDYTYSTRHWNARYGLYKEWYNIGKLKINTINI